MSVHLPPNTYPHVDSWATTRIPFRFVVWIADSPDEEFGPYIDVQELRRVTVFAWSGWHAGERVRRREGIEPPLHWSRP